jgi:teichuronic acid biosynthesis glycosyltransferase TuaH
VAELSSGPWSSWGSATVFAAGVPWSGMRMLDQHMAERLARLTPVLYVDPPVSVYSPSDGWNLPSRRSLNIHSIGESLAQFTPVVLPPKSRGPFRVLTSALVRREISQAVHAHGINVDVVVAATLIPVFGCCNERRRVFYATDDFGAGAELLGVPERWARRRVQSAIARADVVIAVSEHLASVLESSGAADPRVVENGVDYELFAATDSAPPPADVNLPPPIAGFVGHLSDRIDVAILEEVAGRGHSMLLVGPRSPLFELDRIERLLQLPNVQWVGPKPFELLPSYLRVVHVGLLPYTDTAFNRSSFPLKVLEYLAAGRPAVVSDLPAVRNLGGPVRVAQTAEDFADAVGEALTKPLDPVGAEEGRAIARRRSWDVAARRFTEIIGLKG